MKQIAWRRVVSGGLLAGMAAGGQWVYRVEREWLQEGPLTNKLDERERAMASAARQFNLNPGLLEAVAMRETGMDPRARGAAGEIGMFQIMPNTARHWAERTGNPMPTEEELFAVELNTRIAAWYLRQGLDRFAHQAEPLPYALAYYNAGPSRALQWERDLPEGESFTERIPYPGTKDYVKEILSRLRNP